MVSDLITRFSDHKDSERALSMSAYMKGHFRFYGIPSPLRKSLQKEWLIKLPSNFSTEEKWKIVLELWDQPFRECHYVACDWMSKWKKQTLRINDIEIIEHLIQTKSWWDSVDAIAPNILNSYFLAFPEKELETIERWLKSDNLWLKRSCLIYQLKRKESTHLERLEQCIHVLKGEKEFFIQKAIGWSLRQYARLQPEIVCELVVKHQLKGLALREATKHL